MPGPHRSSGEDPRLPRRHRGSRGRARRASARCRGRGTRLARQLGRAQPRRLFRLACRANAERRRAAPLHAPELARLHDPLAFRRAVGLADDAEPQDRSQRPARARSTVVASAPAVAGNREGTAKLAELWGEVLGVSPDRPHDDFFDLGGHSLLVAKLLRGSRRRSAAGCRRPPSSTAPTLEAMAALLVEPEAPALPAIIELSPRARGRLCSGSWRSRRSAPLARRARPMTSRSFGVASTCGWTQPLGDSARAARRVRAGTLIAGLREAQPAGPYYLGGHCTDGHPRLRGGPPTRAEGAPKSGCWSCCIRPTRCITVAAACAVRSRQDPVIHLEEPAPPRAGAVELRLRPLRRPMNLQRALRGPAHRWQRLPAIGTSSTMRRCVYEPAPYPGDVALLQPAERPAILDYRRAVGAESSPAAFAAFEVPGGPTRTMLRKTLMSPRPAYPLLARLRRAQPRKGCGARTLATGLTRRRGRPLDVSGRPWTRTAADLARLALATLARRTSAAAPRRFRLERDRRRYIVRPARPSRAPLALPLARSRAGRGSGLRVTGPSASPAWPTGDLRFSLSHSRGLALYAVARGLEVGCDLEFRDPPRSPRRAGSPSASSRRPSSATSCALAPRRAAGRRASSTAGRAKKPTSRPAASACRSRSALRRHAGPRRARCRAPSTAATAGRSARV